MLRIEAAPACGDRHGGAGGATCEYLAPQKNSRPHMDMPVPPIPCCRAGGPQLINASTDSMPVHRKHLAQHNSLKSSRMKPHQTQTGRQQHQIHRLLGALHPRLQGDTRGNTRQRGDCVCMQVEVGDVGCAGSPKKRLKLQRAAATAHPHDETVLHWGLAHPRRSICAA